jgi:alanine racemase
VVSPLTAETLESTLTEGFRPSIGDPGMLRAWVTRSEAPFHLEIDTGMARGGIRWTDTATLADVSQVLTAAPGWEGVFTHFHSADTDEGSIAEQWQRLQATLAMLPGRPPLVHAANSAAALCGRAYAADLIRPGIFLYGGEARPGGPAPRPVAALRARVVSVRHLAPGESVSYGATWTADRPTTIATIAVGYADGVPRAAERRADWPPRTMELRGRRVPLVGRVTMDMCMAAVDDGEVAAGDIATLFGGLISLDEHARSAGMISYEALTSLGPRLPRRYG